MVLLAILLDEFKTAGANGPSSSSSSSSQLLQRARGDEYSIGHLYHQHY
jgi:hypothetical protein